MSDETPEVEQAMQELGAAVARMSRAVAGSDLDPIVTRFYVIAETIDEHGQKMLEAYRSADCSLWDALGMMDFERTVERGKVEHSC